MSGSCGMSGIWDKVDFLSLYALRAIKDKPYHITQTHLNGIGAKQFPKVLEKKTFDDLH